MYETFKGWQKDTSKIRKKEDLPKEALKYLEFIEKNTKIPISWVGTGPGHDAMIKMIWVSSLYLINMCLNLYLSISFITKLFCFGVLMS